MVRIHIIDKHTFKPSKSVARGKESPKYVCLTAVSPDFRSVVYQTRRLWIKNRLQFAGKTLFHYFLAVEITKSKLRQGMAGMAT